MAIRGTIVVLVIGKIDLFQNINISAILYLNELPLSFLDSRYSLGTAYVIYFYIWTAIWSLCSVYCFYVLYRYLLAVPKFSIRHITLTLINVGTLRKYPEQLPSLLFVSFSILVLTFFQCYSLYSSASFLLHLVRAVSYYINFDGVWDRDNTTVILNLFDPIWYPCAISAYTCELFLW